MIKLKVVIDSDVLDAVQDAIVQSPQTMRVFVERSLKNDVERTLLQQLQTDPPKPSYPLTWRSERQRRFVMAKLRRENNLPYQRTGRLIRSWKIKAVAQGEGGLLTVENDTPYAAFVVGSGDIRQPMFPHWYHVDELVERESVRATDMLIEAWFEVIDPKPGTRFI